MTQTPKPGPGPHVVVPATITIDETDVSGRRTVKTMPHDEFMLRINALIAAGNAGSTTVAQITETFQLATDAMTPNERLLNEIFAAPACAAVDMGLGCTEAATWTAELTCCHLRELCCDAHHTDIAGSRRDVVCSNCHTPGRMGRLVAFTPYAGSTR